jgi:hypothetical protein
MNVYYVYINAALSRFPHGTKNRRDRFVVSPASSFRTLWYSIPAKKPLQLLNNSKKRRNPNLSDKFSWIRVLSKLYRIGTGAFLFYQKEPLFTEVSHPVTQAQRRRRRHPIRLGLGGFTTFFIAALRLRKGTHTELIPKG